MRAIAVTILLLASSAPLCYAQRTRADFAAEREHERRSIEAEQRWRESKKLTRLEKIPDVRKRQSECLSPTALADGSIGYLEYWQYHILQVVGPTDLILAIKNPDIPPLWLTNYPTEGLVDGDNVRLVGPVEVTGTKKYEALLGNQTTIRVIELVAPERAAEIEAELKAKAEAHLYRVWTDSTGKHSIEAKFVEFKSNGVYLERRDNKEVINLPVSRLSPEDRQWIREHLAAEREKKKKAEEAERAARKGRSPERRG